MIGEGEEVKEGRGFELLARICSENLLDHFVRSESIPWANKQSKVTSIHVNLATKGSVPKGNPRFSQSSHDLVFQTRLSLLFNHDSKRSIGSFFESRATQRNALGFDQRLGLQHARFFDITFDLCEHLTRISPDSHMTQLLPSRNCLPTGLVVFAEYVPAVAFEA